MTTLDERDWELINGYADGALTPAERDSVARRLTTEPAMAAALAEVQKVKAGLSLLSPTPAPAAAPRKAGGRRWTGPLALAAAAAAVALVTAAALGLRPGAPAPGPDTPGAELAGAATLADVHAAFSARAYALGQAGPAGTISTGSMGDLAAFDLSASRLTLVDVRDMRAGGHDLVAMHYRGPRGCRLTIAAVAGGELAAGGGEDALTVAWTAGGIGFHAIATGMDEARFGAIAAFLRAGAQRPTESDGLRVALSAATEAARPCA